MKQYLVRSFRYMIYLIILFIIIYGVMVLTGTSRVSPKTLGLFFTSKSGLLMIGIIVGLSLLYPLFGFVTRPVRASLLTDRGLLISLMEGEGFVLKQETDGILHFRAVSPLKRLAMRYDDDIVLNTNGPAPTMSGNRRAVTRILFRLDTLHINR